MFTVYILYSPTHQKTYVGFTSDLEARFKAHNELGIKGWTIRYRPWIIIHMEEFEEKKDAMQREKVLKSGKGRNWVKILLEEYLLSAPLTNSPKCRISGKQA